ncbi:MAG: hypothetical protein QGF74_02210, partial [Candidatus Nanoarchaeia archaeon]|nr:hypothetical protein [Candidatus Nanoarchaeia archaeon]
YCNDAREINLCKMLFDAAHKRNLDPNALMTLLFAEGLAAPDSYSIKNYYLGDINSKDHKIIFDPFGETGADSLNENMIRRLQSLGYLRKDLKIGNGITKFRSTLNEKRESVKYAQFDNLQDLIESSTALYKYYDRLFERDFKEAKEKGIIPTNRELDPRERIAWSFLYYNCGPGTGKNELFGRRYSSPTIQKNQIFQGFGLDLTKKYQHISGKREGSKIVIRSNVCRKHALERTATWEIMDEFRILNPPIFGSKTVAKK